MVTPAAPAAAPSPQIVVPSPQIAAGDAVDDTARPPPRPAKLTKLAPYRLEWRDHLPSFVFSLDGSELLYVDAERGALMAAPRFGGKPRVVYASKVGYVHRELEGGDALVLIDERYQTSGNLYTEHYRRVDVKTGASTEVGRELPSELRVMQDSARFRSAGVEGVQPFRVGNLLGGQTPSKELVVLDGGKVVTVCRSLGRDLAWPHPLEDGRRLAQPVAEQLYLADLTTRTCVATDDKVATSSFVYPALAATTDGKWVLYPRFRAPPSQATDSEITLHLADAQGHAKLVAELPGAIGVRPATSSAPHHFVYAVNWPAGKNAYRTVFYELDADTGATERRTCAMTTASEASTAPDFQLSPDRHAVAVAISKPGACGITEAGIYVLEL
jgi:hypothetical protein